MAHRNTSVEARATALMRTNRMAGHCRGYIVTALRHKKTKAARSIVDACDKRPGWLYDVYKAFVAGIGVGKCVDFVNRYGDRNLAFYLSIHHKGELTERHDAILSVAILEHGPPKKDSVERTLVRAQKRREFEAAHPPRKKNKRH